MKKKYIVIITTAILLSNIVTGAFFNAYYLQVPWVVSFRPLVVSRVKSKPTPKPPKKLTVVTKEAIASEKAVRYSLEFETAYDTVHFNESNRGNDKSGLNGECIAKGLINEIGYAPHDHWCFKNKEEQKDTFMLWLQNRLDHKKTPYCNTIKDCILYYTNFAYTI